VCRLLGIAVRATALIATIGMAATREAGAAGQREAALWLSELKVLVEREGERVNHKRLVASLPRGSPGLKWKKRRYCARVGLPRPMLTGVN